MKYLKKTILGLLGNIYIPKEILQSKGKKLLHISDTPSEIFPSLKKLINNLKPDYIIHTGDMVDNLKIEMYPNKVPEYRKSVKVIIDILEDSSSDNIFIALGNHDSRGIVEEYCKRCIVVEDYSLEIQGFSFNLSHYPENIRKNPAQYNLFGHDLSIKSGRIEEKVYLNGICNINIINLESMKIYYLPYPWGTDDSRLCKVRFKI